MKELKYLNVPLLTSHVLLFIIGIVTLFSTSPELAREQLVYFLIGIVFYFIILSQDVQLLRYIWKPMYIVQILLLILTFAIGDTRMGASRWINIWFVTFQPSELAKVVLLVAIASLNTEYGKDFQNLKNLTKILLISVPLLTLVVIQPDLGTTIVLFSILLGLLFYSGLNKIYILVLATIFGILSTPIWNMLHDYQQQRILVFINPQLDILGSGYNVIQSLIAIGSGGLTGQGFSRGTQTHLNFLPAHWTDFIFASYSEEWGLVGVIIFLFLYLALLLSILRTASKVKNPFGSILVFGVFIIFFVQFLVNTGMNLGIMPVTGIPLPLVSYGGTSMLVSCTLLGLTQRIWMSEKMQL